MFLMTVMILAAIGLPVGLAATLITHDLHRLVELTAIGTALSFLVVVFAWRWAVKHDVATQEAKTPWLHEASSIAHGLDAWGLLRGEVKYTVQHAENADGPSESVSDSQAQP